MTMSPLRSSMRAARSRPCPDGLCGHAEDGQSCGRTGSEAEGWLCPSDITLVGQGIATRIVFLTKAVIHSGACHGSAVSRQTSKDGHRHRNTQRKP